jgi:transglutaminase-like putative cysteine protease
MNPKLLFSILCLSLVWETAIAQDKSNAKFGKVLPEDFAPKAYAVDSNANAVVIADVGSSKIVGNNKGWFSIEFKRYCRAHILNKNAFDIATEEIELYSDGDREEKLSDIRAVTYNLENGKVVETKLDKDNIFKNKVSKNLVEKKFTFPNIKEGSIIEFEYTITSDFLRNLQPWTFQGDYPTLWSEYNLRLPSFFSYLFLGQGYQKFFINTRKDWQDQFKVTETNGTDASQFYTITTAVTDYRWVIKDAPALKDEGYVSTVRNHVQKIEFELSSKNEPLEPHIYISSWPQMSEELLNDEDFGLSLSKDMGWLSDADKAAMAGATSSFEKAKKIYAYVRDNFTCTDYSEKWLQHPLKNVLKTRNGTVAEINLLLVAMLRYAGIDADPVILSTRTHGYTYALYPILNKFNYVICDATIDGKQIFLDATRPRLGFGKLTPACYNGHARIINSAATPLEFSADSLMERKMTSVMLTTDDKGDMTGSLQQVPGYFESHEIRETVKEKGQDEFFKTVKKNYGQEVELVSPHIDSLNNLEESVGIGYNFKLNQEKEDILYINPMFGEGYKENPFKSAQRFYPVEMPYASDETYIFSMIVPQGYIVDELPKSVIVKLNDAGDGQFEYIFSETNGTISMRSRIQLKRAYYQPAEYDLLREFFNLVVKKQSEQIVLKKKK